MFTKRLVILSTLFALGAGAIVMRLADVMLINSEEIQQRAFFARERKITMPSTRGLLTDRDGKVLARDEAAFEVLVVPSTFRERSLLNAVVDASILLKTDRSDEPRLALRSNVMANPEEWCEQLLQLPASETQSSDLKSSGRRLVTKHGGELLRSDAEMEYRLRQCLGVIQGRGLACRTRDYRKIQAHAGSLGESLGVTFGEVAERLRQESQVLASLGAEVGLDGLVPTLLKIDALIRSEKNWVERRQQGELADALCLDLLGTPRPSPTTMDAADYAALSRGLTLTFPDSTRGRRRAHDSLQGASALMGGSLPMPAWSAPDTDASDPIEALADPNPEYQGSIPEDILQRAHAHEVFDLRSSRVRSAWVKQQMKEGLDSSKYLTARRIRDLRNRDRGGRAFLFGVGAHPEAAMQVVGPGRFQELGFRLEPVFARRQAKDLDPEIARLIGKVGLRSRRGIAGVEAALDHLLRGKDGEARRRPEDGALEPLIQPQHGEDLVLSLSLDLTHRLAELLPPDEPGAIAILDIRTGGILGMASSPRALPQDENPDLQPLDELRESLEHEKRLLVRFSRVGEEQLIQALGALEDRAKSGTLSTRERVEISVMRLILNEGGDAVDRRIREINMEKAGSAGWHRAYDMPNHCPPGSVFKALTLMAGLEANVINSMSFFNCIGTKRGRHKCKDHGPDIGIRTALKKSCNEYCYQVGKLLGSDAMVDLYRDIGFFDAIPGLLGPYPKSFERVLRAEAPQNLSIGGGSIDCPPVRAVGIAASLARGRVVHPWLVKPPGFEPIGKSIASERTLSLIRDGMVAVSEIGGTAGRVKGLQQLRVAAKTGTADHTGPEGPESPEVNEAWFVGYAPFENPRYAFAVVLNNTKKQGADAAPIAAKALELCAEIFGDRWW